MRVAGIIKNSVVNGQGIRDVLFLQGCKHRCKGCHNPETWNLEGGTEYTLEDLVDEFKDSPNQITISGGEPLLQIDELYRFMRVMTRQYGKRFWVYTGYKFEDIPYAIRIMLYDFVDVLVDGRFEIDKKDLRLPFRGSSNQRLLNFPISFAVNAAVEWRDKDEEV